MNCRRPLDTYNLLPTARCLLLTGLLLLTACCLLPTVATAQTTNATLSGVVEDENGAVVPGVKISVTNPATGLERTVVTDSSGAYIVPLLPPATYTVTAEQTGFATVKFPNITLNVNDQRSLQIELKVGAVGGAVEVRADAVTVSTSPAVATTVDRTFVGNLPLSGRSFQSLIFLTPGIVATPSQFDNPGEFSVNGQRTNANYFTVDGVSANAGINANLAGNAVVSNALAGQLPGLGASGSTSTLVSVDALEEFKIQTSTYSAQFGRQPGAQAQLSTRSGTNDFHGTLFEYIRNEAFDARNYFNKEPARKPPTRLNQFGGTFSGPIYLPRFGDGGPGWYNGKERTFFFFSFEGQRLRLPVPPNKFNTVPSLRIRQLAPAQFKPILNAFPLPTGDEILVSCDPATAGCSPAGTRPSGDAPWLVAFSDPKSQDATSIRIDHKISDRHSFFGRYNHAPSNSLSRFWAQLWGDDFDSHLLTFGLTSSLSSRISNEFRFNHTRSSAEQKGWMDDFGGAVPIDVSVLLPGYSGELKNVEGRFAYRPAFGGSDIFIGDNSKTQQRQYNIVDNLTWAIGNHMVNFGFDFRRLAPVYGPLQYRQQAAFRLRTFEQETSFLNGNVFSVSVQGQGTAVRPRFDNFSAYIQDTWKVSRRLTFDLGFRW
ncbi:MAG TPA: carboxypeptidase regulatory-like domain-containing protein, partial [Pyrinomonadaceae bacterium]